MKSEVVRYHTFPTSSIVNDGIEEVLYPSKKTSQA